MSRKRAETFSSTWRSDIWLDRLYLKLKITFQVCTKYILIFLHNHILLSFQKRIWSYLFFFFTLNVEKLFDYDI